MIWTAGLALLLSAAAGCERRGGPVILARAQAPAATEDPAATAAVEQVRRGYLGRDWWGCAQDGAALRAKYPDSARLQAWTILCVARSGGGALAQAEAMLAERPGDPWALFARAGALLDHPSRGKLEAIPAARAAMAALDEHPDAVWQLGRALIVHAPRIETAQFFAGRGGTTPDLLALELAFLIQSAEATEAQVLELAAKTRAADPNNVDADYAAAVWLMNRRRADQAGPLLVRALEQSPHATALHTQLWEALLQASDPAAAGDGKATAVDVPLVRERDDDADPSPSWEALLQASRRGPEARRATLDAAVASLLRARPDSPGAFKAAADVYETLAPELHAKYEAEILERFPDSHTAEWIRLEQIGRLTRAHHERQTKNTPDPAADALLAAQIEALLRERPPADPFQRAVLYMERYFLLRDDPKDAPEVLLSTVQAWIEVEPRNFHVLGDAALELAERTPYKREAEAVLRRAITQAEAMLREDRAQGLPQEFVDENANWLQGQLSSALGSVLLAQGRRDEAREAFAPVQALKQKSPQALVRLAAFAEAEGRIADAEQLLIEGLALWDGEKSCEEALRALYRRQHGNERGYARHRTRLEDAARAQRRAQVLATALAEPKPLPPFELPRLGDEALRSEALRGRVAVLNLWTTWCGPCVAEMPALQQLADAYAKDPDVAILTINAEPRTDELPAWLAERKVHLEVLLGARWTTDNGYNTLPMTLFLDREGQIVFSHEGASERLVEEFTWRIEALRAKGSPTPRPQIKRTASG
ncbi:redoxin domain-containing protein [Nannocystis radixulma]|uniref:Redoxin domain-containing protein n=1 Tax=Nannocystis radixulma TaxID=2995305 RepID=A0ABT5BHP6_9BACT|nr:redoxin domain-containing protein [Nannocystis radixulma]MDC0672562.1 redoxin domain-containing protein [Nannocystis radixulma]